MLEDINILIRKLDWSIPINSQQDAIKQLLSIDEEDVVLLVQPMEKKHLENSAKVLQMMGYPRNKLAIPGMIKWLKDLNWPGAVTAMETLQSIEISEVLPHLEIAIEIAIEENDDMWIMALKELAINRMYVKASDFKNNELYEILEQFE